MDIGSLLGDSWKRFSANLGGNIVTFLVGALVSAVLSGISFGIAGIPVMAGLFKAFRKVQQGGSADMSDLFSEFSNFGKWFMLWVVFLGLGLVSAITFGIGGIIGGFLLFLTIPIMIDKDMQAFDAAKASFEYMKANVGTMIVPVIVTSLVSAAGGIIYIGTLVTCPWMLIANWYIYDHAMGLTAEPAAYMPPAE